MLSPTHMSRLKYMPALASRALRAAGASGFHSSSGGEVHSVSPPAPLPWSGRQSLPEIPQSTAGKICTCSFGLSAGPGQLCAAPKEVCVTVTLGGKSHPQ